MEDIIISNVIMDNVIAGITANGYYECGADKNDTELFSPLPAKVTEDTPIIRNLNFSGVIMKNVRGAGIYFNGLCEMPVSNVKIINIDISAAPDGTEYLSVMAPGIRVSCGEGIYLKNVKDIVISDCRINTCAERIILEQFENVYINGEKQE